MSEERALAEIIQTLTVHHGCLAITLYGSRARGDFQSTSDWLASARATRSPRYEWRARSTARGWTSSFTPTLPSR